MNAILVMGNTSLGILLVCVLIMLYLAWYDHKTLIAKNEEGEQGEHSDQEHLGQA